MFVLSDVRCGTLQCDISRVADLTPDNYRLSLFGNRSHRVSGLHCRFAQYLTFYNGPDTKDPGLVPDGASCATGKVCLSAEDL